MISYSSLSKGCMLVFCRWSLQLSSQLRDVLHSVLFLCPLSYTAMCLLRLSSTGVCPAGVCGCGFFMQTCKSMAQCALMVAAATSCLLWLSSTYVCLAGVCGSGFLMQTCQSMMQCVLMVAAAAGFFMQSMVQYLLAVAWCIVCHLQQLPHSLEYTGAALMTS
jgi:hypothetical protein